MVNAQRPDGRDPETYDVFISAKLLDEAGHPTEDRTIGERLWSFLAARGFRVFFSPISLETLGVSAYKRAIDDALDSARALVLVCTFSANADSQWVRYEWDSFLNDIISGLKPEGRVFVYLVNETIRNLPRGLRINQCITHGPDGFDTLARFLTNALKPDAAISAPVDPISPVPPVRDVGSILDGKWEGEWQRHDSLLSHRGELTIMQNGTQLTAQLQVSYQKAGRTTVVLEQLRGVVNDRQMLLQGESYQYLERGASTNYLLDHFEMTLAGDGLTLSGDFYSKKGRGWARFTRIT